MRPQLRIPAARFATLALVLVTWIALGSGPVRSSCPGPTLMIDGGQGVV